MSQYTKGPWTAYEVRSGNMMIIGKSSHIATVAIGAGSDKKSDLANTKLIAAAPELLEALQSVKTLIPAMLNFAWITEAEADAIRKAIQKATS